MSSYQIFLKIKNFKSLQAFRHKRTHKASLSVEAALCFSLFIIAMSILIMPFDMMNTNRKIRGIAESVCKDSSQYAYTYMRLKGGSAETGRDDLAGESDFDHEAMEKIKGVFAGGALGSFAVARVNEEIADRNIHNITGLFSSCMADGETIQVKIDYEYALPAGILGIHSIKQSVLASRRAWIGADGGKGGGEEVKGEKEEQYVYIGRTSKRYHMDPHCHYLYNDLRAVPLADIADCRNTSGGIYHACERCGGGASGTVYIMPSGSRYHSSASCTAIVAYVERVRLSEVEHLGPCSYCGGSH